MLGYLRELHSQLIQDEQLMIKRTWKCYCSLEELWLVTLEDLHTKVKKVNIEVRADIKSLKHRSIKKYLGQRPRCIINMNLT